MATYLVVFVRNLIASGGCHFNSLFIDAESIESLQYSIRHEHKRELSSIFSITKIETELD